MTRGPIVCSVGPANDGDRERQTTSEAAMDAVRGACVLLLPWLLAGCVGPSAGELQLRRELDTARLQLRQAREQALANKLACATLEQDHSLALASARQLRADTQYLRTSSAKLSDAVTRLSYQDWNKVVPEVQLDFTDVEAAAQDLDARVGRVLIALHADDAPAPMEK
jgi:hypothetical protein